MFDFLLHFISTCFSFNDLRYKLLLLQFQHCFHAFFPFFFKYACCGSVHVFEILKSLQLCKKSLFLLFLLYPVCLPCLQKSSPCLHLGFWEELHISQAGQELLFRKTPSITFSLIETIASRNMSFSRLPYNWKLTLFWRSRSYIHVRPLEVISNQRK